MSFQISGLDPANFRHLFGRSDDELARHNARRVIADADPGFPDRIGLLDVSIGTPVLLLNHLHQPAITPYRASHAIFVREFAEVRAVFVDTVPDVLARRVISLRAFDAADEMSDAALVPGDALADEIQRMLETPATRYLQAHFATRGCFAAQIERA